MQNIILLVTFITLLFSLQVSAQGIGIGTTEVDPSAVLEIDSEDGNQGLLIPRIADRAQIDLSGSPKGVMIYDTSDDGFYYYDGTNWLRLVTTPVGIDLDMNSYKITNLSDGVVDGDAVNKSQLDEKASITQLNEKANKTQSDFQTTNIIYNAPWTGTLEWRLDEWGMVTLKGYVRSNGATSGEVAEVSGSLNPNNTYAYFVVFKNGLSGAADGESAMEIADGDLNILTNQNSGLDERFHFSVSFYTH